MSSLLARVCKNPSFYFWKLYYTVCGKIVRSLCPIEKNKVLFWADAFNSYGCNPKAISDYILANHSSEFAVYWAFCNPLKIHISNKKFNLLKFASFRYVYHVNTAEFLITNHRTLPEAIYWSKRAGQKYVMTWHGSMGIKRAEADMERTHAQIELAKIDSSNCDVMMSDSKWYDATIKRQLEYYGNVLHVGTPRNDIYYNPQKVNAAKKTVRDFYGIKDHVKILLYAPTFRDDHKLDTLITKWDEYRKELGAFFGGEYVVMIRLHQVMKRALAESKVDMGASINATEYNDMQELLCAADLLITDYSSTMFDMGILGKPCILYATDVEKYNRGFLFDIFSLPMPVATNSNEFKTILRGFDMEKYEREVNKFYDETFDIYPGGQACKGFISWMKQNSNNNE